MVTRSTLTSKGQTTIPNEIRKKMDLKPGDGLVYSIEGERIVIRPVKGTLLDAYASVKPKRRPEDFPALRRQTRKKRAGKIRS
ncbi:MAG: AbrB/MazE/SpoVT family DNA-binding domain-containing protein [Thermoleophilia bacterium]|nr:AbrB/MazE/SpoVT family DNA-binding domain-containing protein [Thermoleophilia bacterium]